MHMKLSIEKTIIPSNGPKGQVWKVEQGTSDLEAALVGKYLGVNIQVKGTNIIKAREERMIGIAQKYANTIMGIARSGLDRALVAHTLWEGCAVPAKLYAQHSTQSSAFYTPTIKLNCQSSGIHESRVQTSERQSEETHSVVFVGDDA